MMGVKMVMALDEKVIELQEKEKKPRKLEHFSR